MFHHLAEKTMNANAAPGWFSHFVYHQNEDELLATQAFLEK